jgi:uroporphyrinogen decarboxylase
VKRNSGRKALAAPRTSVVAAVYCPAGSARLGPVGGGYVEGCTMAEMTSRERLRRTLRRQEPDRVPLLEICFWPETVQRWYREGLPAGQQPAAFFGFDGLCMTYVDSSLGLPAETLEDGPEHTLTRDRDGIVRKAWKQSYATPADVDHAVKTREDWLAHRHRLIATPERIPAGHAEMVRAAHAQGQFVTVSPFEPTWWVLRTLGEEEALPLMALDPEWFGEMVTAHAAMTLEQCRQLLAAAERPDAVWFFADLCYRNGMLFSPRAYRELVMPHHRRLADLCHEHDVSLIIHCDGYLGEFIPLLIEAGFDCVQPLEARAGNDVRQLKPLYGDRLAFFGNMNMDVFAAGDLDAIATEVTTKLAAAMPGGGYIWHSDHSVPPTVSFVAYTHAVELARRHGRYDG